MKPGAVVLDVGINVREGAKKDKKHRLVGDVHFSGVSGVASALTPVPGGKRLSFCFAATYFLLRCSAAASGIVWLKHSRVLHALCQHCKLLQPCVAHFGRCGPDDHRRALAQHSRSCQAACRHLEAAELDDVRPGPMAAVLREALCVGASGRGGDSLGICRQIQLGCIASTPTDEGPAHVGLPQTGGGGTGSLD